MAVYEEERTPDRAERAARRAAAEKKKRARTQRMVMSLRIRAFSIVFLIFAAALRLFKKLAKTPFALAVFVSVTLAAVALSLFAIRFSSVWFVLIGAALGLFAYLFALLHRGNGENGDRTAPDDAGEGGTP